MKTYVITLSKTFGVKHPKCGMPTGFRELYEEGIKIHTIRANYPLWRQRFESIKDGEACLSLRQWLGKPYASKQELICNLYSTDGIGLQQLVFSDGDITMPRVVQEVDLFNPEVYPRRAVQPCSIRRPEHRELAGLVQGLRPHQTNGHHSLYQIQIP